MISIKQGSTNVRRGSEGELKRYHFDEFKKIQLKKDNISQKSNELDNSLLENQGRDSNVDGQLRDILDNSVNISASSS